MRIKGRKREGTTKMEKRVATTAKPPQNVTAYKKDHRKQEEKNCSWIKEARGQGHEGENDGQKEMVP